MYRILQSWGRSQMSKLKKVRWFLLVFCSALNGVQAIFLFEKSPWIAVFLAFVSYWMLKHAMWLSNQPTIKKGTIMGEKIVAMISEDESLKAICTRINQRKIFADKRMEDFHKQAQEKMEAIQKENEADWELVTTWLREKGRLPDDYNTQTHNVSFNVKDNGIKVGKNGESHLSDLPFPLPPGSKIKQLGTFGMDDLPPELQKQMMEFIKERHKDE